MEIQEQILSLEAEKIAIDQLLVSSLKECIAAKKDALLKDHAINSLNKQIQELLHENNDLEQSLAGARGELDSLKSSQVSLPDGAI
jgi:hypothetical protein